MNSRTFWIAALFVAGRALAIEIGDVKVEVALANASAALPHEVEINELGGSVAMIDVVFTNRSSEAVHIEALSVSFPWLEAASESLLVSSGASNMAEKRMTVSEAGRGEAVNPSSTYLLAKDGPRCQMAAFLSWNTFSTYLTLEGERLVARALGEGRRLAPGESLAFERIYLDRGEHWQDLMFDYADAIAQELSIELPPPTRFVGWSTWDYYGRDWTMPEVVANAKVAKALVPSTNLIQIDGGWWPHRGDYLTVRENLQPDGMKRLARDIRKLGLTPGIHFDGMRGDLKAEVAKKHPDYFLKDDTGALIHNSFRNDGDLLENIYFDFSNPGTQRYLDEVVSNMRRNWGYDYIKIDFLMYGLNEDIRKRAFGGDASRAIVPHDRGLTSVERIKIALKVFRKAMGEDAYFLACSAPLGIVFGHADGLRTGPDIFPAVRRYAISCLATGANFYLKGKVAHVDADYLVSRSAADEDERLVDNPAKSGGDLTLAEAEMWANYVGLFGGPVISSDNLTILREERRDLFQLATGLPKCERFVPLDYWKRGRSSDDAFHAILGESEGRCYLALFNWSDRERVYRLNLGKSDLERISGRADEATLESAESYLMVTLPSRRSAVFALGDGADFDRVRNELLIE